MSTSIPTTPVVFINCQGTPWIKWIMDHFKTHETRTRNTLGCLVGKVVLLAETGKWYRPLIRCRAKIAEVIAVHSCEEWEEYLQDTWVPVGSKYDWKDDTKVKYLYRLEDVHPVAEPFFLPQNSVRHGRVWAELNWEEV